MRMRRRTPPHSLAPFGADGKAEAIVAELSGKEKQPGVVDAAVHLLADLSLLQAHDVLFEPA